MKIAILGGRFDPPHIGHFLVARQILDFRKDIDKVLLVPAFAHPWKPIIASPEDRLSMLQSFAGTGMEVSDIDIKRKGMTYTIDTIKEVKKNTGAEIYWIVGSDILPEFKRWKDSEELLKLANFLVVPRDPHALPKKVPEGFEVINSPKLITTNFSSTLIRDRVKQGESIENIVPKCIEQYIREHKLYV
jgi:nicotinate-nucleotide adenylyltransferase